MEAQLCRSSTNERKAWIYLLYQFKISIQPSFGLEINTVSLTQPRHINPGPELSSLVQEDLVAERAVLVVITVFVS